MNNSMNGTVSTKKRSITEAYVNLPQTPIFIKTYSKSYALGASNVEI